MVSTRLIDGAEKLKVGGGGIMVMLKCCTAEMADTPWKDAETDTTAVPSWLTAGVNVREPSGPIAG